MVLLDWQGCVNVRDLGGHATEDGGRTREGAVVRADSVARLSEQGWRAVAGYGVSRIVDLRFDDEREADPPAALDLDVVHVPLLGAARDPEYWAWLDELLDTAPTAADYLRRSYLEFLDRFRGNFAAALEAVASAPAGAVVVHCMIGKDRTGLVTALLLRLAGVPVEEIDADYAASERPLEAVNRAWIERAPDGLERRRRSRLSESPAGVMAPVLRELETAHGGLYGYLAAAGVPDETAARLRARLREEDA